MNEKKKILVVDDDKDYIKFVRTVLTREDFDVISAMDGKEGLTKATTECPDLIILDVIMPEEDGWEICEKLRSCVELEKVPIVYLTSVDSPKSLYMDHGAFEADWDEYLTKPVSPKVLLTTVRKLLRNSTSTV